MLWLRVVTCPISIGHHRPIAAEHFQSSWNLVAGGREGVISD